MQNEDLVQDRPMAESNIKMPGYGHLGGAKVTDSLVDFRSCLPHHQQQQQQQSRHPDSRTPSPNSSVSHSPPMQHLAPAAKLSPPPATPNTPSARGGGAAGTGGPSPLNSPSAPMQQHAMKPNQVRSVMLNGVPIVALIIDAKERLCLAQISNTLLKEFSYNEIHNRRVALGITCVQCTPVQLEILRRAGAMPISSRRCGMITKREAERLCKSFLTENNPPKLPENFSFDVVHECAWGSRGSFLPSRYNSSRAKCIKCYYCNMFFSPNKFIFHSHRVPDSKYVQPDAANFNSWRRHLKLYGGPPNEIAYAWEDVKAMFNGGSRKRVMAASYTRFTNMKRLRQAEAMNNMMHATASANMTHSDKVPVASPSYGPAMPPYGGSNKTYGHPGMPQASSTPVAYLAPRSGPPPPPSPSCSNFVTAAMHVQSPGMPLEKGLLVPAATGDLRGPPHPLAEYVWTGKMGPSPCALPPSAAAYGFIWARQQQQVHHHHHHLHHQQLGAAPGGTPGGLPLSTAAGATPDPLKMSPESFYHEDRHGTNFRLGGGGSGGGGVGGGGGGDDSSDSSRGNCDSEVEAPGTRRSMSSCSEQEFRSSDNDELIGGGGGRGGFSSGRRSKDSGFFGAIHHPHQQHGHAAAGVAEKPPGYCSAFRPVVRSHSGPTLHTVESLIRPSAASGTKCGSSSPGDVFRAVAAATGHYVNTGGVLYLPRDQSHSPASKDSSSGSSKSGDSDRVIDVEMMDDCKEDDKLVVSVKVKGRAGSPVLKKCRSDVAVATTTNTKDEFCCPKDAKEGRLSGSPTGSWPLGEATLRVPLTQAKLTSLDIKEPSGFGDTLTPMQVQGRHQGMQNEAIDPILPLDLENKKLDANLTKEELEDILVQETEARRRAEKQCEIIKESYQEQVKREISYREEITKQLEIVKETLCNELDHERKARFAVLQKLKESYSYT